MDEYHRGGSGSGREFGQQLLNLGRSFVDYLRTREPEHWLFFAVGIIFGILIS